MKDGLMDLTMSTIMTTEVTSVSLSDTRQVAKEKLASTPAYVEGAPVLDDGGVVVGVVLKSDLDEGNPTVSVLEAIFLSQNLLLFFSVTCPDVCFLYDQNCRVRY